MGVNGIYGLSGSGLDIDSMVKAGMLSKKNEYDKMQQKYTANEWKKAEYLDLYGQVQTFSLSTLSQYKMSNSMNARGATSSNDAIVSATANATAANMTHYVEVGQLASAAYLIGTEQLKAQNLGDTNSVQLADALFSDFKSRETTSSETNGDYTTDSSKISAKLTELGATFDSSNGTYASMLVKNDGTTVVTNSTGNYTAFYDGSGTLFKTATLNSDGTVTVKDVLRNKTSSATKMITASSELSVTSKDATLITYKDADGKTNVVDGDTVAFSFSVGDGGSGDELVSSNENLFDISISTNVSLTETHTVEVTKAVERAKVSGSETILNGSQDASRLFAKMFDMDSDDFANAMTRLVKDKDNGTHATETAFSFEIGIDAEHTTDINITYADLASDVSINEMVKNLNKKISTAISEAGTEDLKNSLRKMQVEFRDGTLSFVNTQYGSDSTIQFGISTANGFTIPKTPEVIQATPLLDMTTNTKLIEYMGSLGQVYSSTTNLEFSYTVTDGYDGTNTVNSSVSMAFSDISTLSVGEFIDKLNKEFEKAGADIKAEYVWADDLKDSGTIQFSTSYVDSGSSLKFDVSGSGDSKKFAAGLFGLLDSNHDIISDGTVTQPGTSIDNTEVTASLTSFFGLVEDNNSYTTSDVGVNGNVTVDGVSYDLEGTNSLTIKSEGGGRITYKFVDGSTGTGTVSNVGPSNNIDVTYAQLANGYTFNDLVSNINNFGTNIRAAYDSVQDRFSIFNKESGSSNQIILKMNEDDSGASRAAEFFTRMGLAESANGEIKSKSTTSTTSTSTAEPRCMTQDEANAILDGNKAYPQKLYLRERTGIGDEEASEDYIEVLLTSQTEDGNRLYSNSAGIKGYMSVNGDPVGAVFNDNTWGNSYNVYILDNPAEEEEAENGYDTYTFKLGMQSIVSGTNAVAKIDGVDYTDLDSNSVNVNGVIYKFNATTSSLTEDGKVDSTTGSKISVTVTQDAEAIVDKVKSFVEDYNKLLTKLYEWYDTKPNSNYKPLTDTQKESMKDEQIEKWEAKAKEGLLYHDKTLGKIIDELRDAVGDRIEGIVGNYNTVYSIGISTTGSKGQLTLDEDKLRAAIAADSDSVYNIFAKLDKDDQYSNNGIAQRIGDVLSQGMKDIKSVSGSTAEITEDSDLNNLLRELQTKMSNFKKMMAAFEEKLYKKYDAMESSLALLGAQLNYVTGAYQ